MKKTSAMIMAVVICMMLVLPGCGMSQEEKALKTANEVYSHLCSAMDKIDEVMNSISAARRIGASKAYDGSTFNTAFLAKLAKDTSLPEEDLSAAIEYLGERSLTKDTAINNCMEIIIEVYRRNGTFDEINASVDSAFAVLKTASAEFDNYDYFVVLRALYFEVEAYAEFAQYPEANAYQNYADNYKDVMDAYRKALLFVFD